MHSVWNSWWHGSVVSDSPSTYSPMQIEHSVEPSGALEVSCERGEDAGGSNQREPVHAVAGKSASCMS